jgi:flagellar hook protein FlgE
MLRRFSTDKADMVMAVVSGLAGYQRAEKLMEETAATLVGQPGKTPREGETSARLQGDSADLSAETVDWIQAQNTAAASLKTIQTANRMTKSVFEILGY